MKKLGGMEFFEAHFSYLDTETMEEKFISVPEQGGGSLIPAGPLNPGVMHSVATGSSGAYLGLYRLETQVTAGSGNLRTSGLGSNAAKEAIKVGFDYFKADAHRSMPRLSRATTTTTCTSLNCTTPGRRTPGS